MVLFLLAAALLTTAQSADTLSSVQRQRIDSIFAASGADSTAPGCAMAVMRDGVTSYARGYGLADLSHRVPVRRDTRFRIASMTKQFTATAILMLARDGKLQLDDDVRRYVPELPDFKAHITIRHLLTHTSGLRDVSILVQMADWPGAVATGDEAFTLEDFWTFLRRQRELNFAPGTSWLYNNTGYVLLGVIVERLSGMSQREYLAREIFTPLGMDATTLADDHTRVMPDLARGYAFRRGAWQLRDVNSDIVGSTGIVSTVDDVARWNANYAEPRVGSAAIYSAMAEATRLAGGRSAGYGFGLVRGTLDGRLTIAHSGGLTGYSSELLRIPSERLGVTVLCNRRAPEASSLAERVARIVLGDGDPVAGVTGTPVRDSAWVGTYVNTQMDQWVRIAMPPEGLAKSEAGGPLQPLRATGDGFTAGVTSWRFARASGVAEVTVDYGGLPPSTTFTRVERRRSSLTGLAGTYWSPELQHAVTISVKDTVVSLLLTKTNGELPLAEEYPNGFVYGPVTVHFVRPAAGQRPSALTISMHGVRKLRYDRR